MQNRILENYKQNLADVSEGGKDYTCCSFMDISIKLDNAKQELIKMPEPKN